MLEKVKALLGVTGIFQNTTIQAYIDEVKQFLLDGGVAASVVNADSSAGVIARGVADLWNYGSGEGKLSEYFIQRATQLSYVKAPDNDTRNTYYTKDEINDLINSTKVQTKNIEFITNTETDTFDFTGDYDCLQVYVDGIIVPSTRYEVNGNTIKLKHPLYDNQKINIILHKVSNERI